MASGAWGKPPALPVSPGLRGRALPATLSFSHQRREAGMDFVFFFLGIAAVAAGLWYIKQSSPNKPRHHA